MMHKARLTLDMSSDEHAYLKMACTKLGMTMQEFVFLAAFEKIEKIEEDWLAKKAYQTLKRIETSKEKTSSWEKAKERLM